MILPLGKIGTHCTILALPIQGGAHENKSPRTDRFAATLFFQDSPLIPARRILYNVDINPQGSAKAVRGLNRKVGAIALSE